MAVAKQTKRIEIKLVEQEIPHEEVVLTLSKEEAQFILDYLGNTVVGGGLRKHSDAVCGALTAAGVSYDDDFCQQLDGGFQRNHFRSSQGGN